MHLVVKINTKRRILKPLEPLKRTIKNCFIVLKRIQFQRVNHARLIHAGVKM